MLRDVFYFGAKPNVHPREKFATDISDARRQATTEHFWIINEFCDYRNFEWDFDFEFLPDEDVWAENHNNVWPSQHQKDSGTWLCPKEYSNLTIYRTDVDPVKRKNIKTDNWVLLDTIDESKFDFSWHPDPTDPAFIYKWGCKFFPAELKHVLEYRVEGGAATKYMKQTVELLPTDYWMEYYPVDHAHFDFTWRPDPMDPPFIYVWGNKFFSGKVEPTLTYRVPGATQEKHLAETVELLPLPLKFEHLEDSYGIDYSWVPDPTSPPYIYAWGNQWNKPEDKVSIRYVMPGATEYKHMTERATRRVCMDNWLVPDNVDTTGFDFSWEPSPADPAFIYEFGTQHQKTGGPQYIVPGAAKIKYMDTQKVKALPCKDNWELLEDIDTDSFDFSWHPDSSAPPYIYAWGNQWNKSEDKISAKYVVPGATEVTHTGMITTRKPVMDNWLVPDHIDATGFDFSWEPSPADPAFIYEFGTQWQKTGGPQYIVPGATKIKYMDVQRVTALPCKDNWEILENIDLDKFDFSWHPDSSAPPYVYAWGNQWNKSEDKISVKYVVPGATDVKHTGMNAVRLTCMDNWLVPDNVDISKFDFSWEPSPADPPFVYEFGTQWQKTGGPQYVVAGATKKKYIDTQSVTALPLKDHFYIPEGINVADFDYSWHPDDTEESYIYVFGNQWYDGITMPTVYYKVPGATQTKFVDMIKATLAPSMSNWVLPSNVDCTDFDFSWVPNPNDPLYLYEFGTQWQKTGGPQYVLQGASEKKYVDVMKAKALPTKENWVVSDFVKLESFDYSWHPDATEDAYTYVFGTQWQPIGGPTYVMPDAVETKYIDPSVVHAISAENKTNWVIPDDIDATTFDFSWHPHPEDPDYVYQFGTQWQKTGGPKYVSDMKYVDMLPIKYVSKDILSARKLRSTKNWEIPSDFNTQLFDFSWHPDDTEPEYIYHFGTVVGDVHLKDGPKYVTPGNSGNIVYRENILLSDTPSTMKTGQDGQRTTVVSKYYIETTLDDLIAAHQGEAFWAMRSNIDYTEFNFDWEPSQDQRYNINVFGSTESELTQTYFVDTNFYHKRFQDRVFVENKKIEDIDLAKLFIKSNMFFVDKSNPESAQRFEQLKAKYPNIQKTRFLNTWVDTITRCANRSATELCWILNSELDYTDFDFNYYPNPWQMKMVHVFGTQWSHWGNTYLINRDTFANDTKYIKIIEHLSNLNFVKDNTRKATATSCLYDVFVIDFGNSEMFKVLRTLQHKVGNRPLVDVEYADNYLDTFKEILNQVPEKKDHYIWICSSLCDYTNFDFTYICDPFAREQLHVFPSNTQKYGDTFLVNVNKLRELITDMKDLQDYEKINFNQHMKVARYPAPEIVTTGDTHVSSMDVEFDYPYAEMVTYDNKDLPRTPYDPSLWSADVKNIIVTSTGGTRIIVPREAKSVVKKELYDYPYILKTPSLSKSKPLDIVFLSNGEDCADENYEHLLSVTKGLPNRIVRVDGVNGRVAAYHAAAEASESPWMFTVFAKLKVSNKFDWNWQPDRLQVPKHYVFHAKNPVNGLVYGHQAMIAYNKKMTLANQGRGLDFTQDDEHEVLDILSGTANFNVDEWTTWRTAFREALKLCTYPDKVSQDRLNTWLTVADGDYAKYCLDGANDAVAYFDEVAGDYDALKLSYDWAWLKDRFDKRY